MLKWFWITATAAFLIFTINATTLPITAQTCDKTITLSRADTVVGSNYKLAIKATGVDPLSTGFNARKEENSKALRDATQMAMSLLTDDVNPTCRVLLKIAEGDWYFAPVGEGSIIHRIPDMRELLDQKALVISGEGSSKTRLYFDQNVTFFRNDGYFRNVTLTDFELIQYIPNSFRIRGVDYKYGLKTTQGKVLKAYPESTTSQGQCEQKYIKRFVRNSDTAKPYFPFREQKKIPLFNYPRFNHYRIEYGTVTRKVDSSGERYHHVVLDNESLDGPHVF